jgi:hypothetical protein
MAALCFRRQRHQPRRAAAAALAAQTMSANSSRHRHRSRPGCGSERRQLRFREFQHIEGAGDTAVPALALEVPRVRDLGFGWLSAVWVQCSGRPQGAREKPWQRALQSVCGEFSPSRLRGTGQVTLCGPRRTRGMRRPTGPSLWGFNGCQLFATILPSKPFDSSSGPAEKSSSLVFAAFPLPNLRPHRPSMTIGRPLACRNWPRRAPLFGS